MRIAIDPGGTSGIAWRGSGGSLEATQWPGETIVVVLDGFHAGYELSEIVVENLASRPGPGDNLLAPEVIGRVLAWADERGISVVRQDPGLVKAAITRDRLRALGGWKRSEERSRDAARHLLFREHFLGLLTFPETLH